MKIHMQSFQLVQFRPPRQARAGVLLLVFTGWLLLACLQLCWWMAKVLILGAVLAVAAIRGWLGVDRAQVEKPSGRRHW